MLLILARAAVTHHWALIFSPEEDNKLCKDCGGSIDRIVYPHLRAPLKLCNLVSPRRGSYRAEEVNYPKRAKFRTS